VQPSEEERHCPLCYGMMDLTEEECYECIRCHSRSRFHGEELLAMRIPHYEVRMEELRRMHEEVLGRIEEEAGKGGERDMRALRSLHEERQRVLSEYSFMSYFRQFVDRW
jgi:hypothetical protein